MSQPSDRITARDTTPAPVVMSYLLQRVLIGVIAMLLPFVLVIVSYVIAHGFQAAPSGRPAEMPR